MTEESYLQAKIDPSVEAEATRVLASMGLSMSEAWRLFLERIVEAKTFPFEIEIPNELTECTMRQVERGEDLHRAKDVNDLFIQLGI